MVDFMRLKGGCTSFLIVEEGLLCIKVGLQYDITCMTSFYSPDMIISSVFIIMGHFYSCSHG